MIALKQSIEVGVFAKKSFQKKITGGLSFWVLTRGVVTYSNTNSFLNKSDGRMGHVGLL